MDHFTKEFFAMDDFIEEAPKNSYVTCETLQFWSTRAFEPAYSDLPIIPLTIADVLREPKGYIVGLANVHESSPDLPIFVDDKLMDQTIYPKPGSTLENPIVLESEDDQRVPRAQGPGSARVFSLVLDSEDRREVSPPQEPKRKRDNDLVFQPVKRTKAEAKTKGISKGKYQRNAYKDPLAEDEFVFDVYDSYKKQEVICYKVIIGSVNHTRTRRNTVDWIRFNEPYMQKESVFAARARFHHANPVKDHEHTPKGRKPYTSQKRNLKKNQREAQVVPVVGGDEDAEGEDDVQM